ncbi:hypothetical protein D9M73_227100 [compost metagenome]
MHPVVTAVRVVEAAVTFAVLPQRRAGGAFAGIPVAGRAGQALAFDKAFGFTLGAGGFDADRNKVLAHGFGLGHG